MVRSFREEANNLLMEVTPDVSSPLRFTYVILSEDGRKSLRLPYALIGSVIVNFSIS